MPLFESKFAIVKIYSITNALNFLPLFPFSISLLYWRRQNIGVSKKVVSNALNFQSRVFLTNPWLCIKKWIKELIFISRCDESILRLSVALYAYVRFFFPVASEINYHKLIKPKYKRRAFFNSTSQLVNISVLFNLSIKTKILPAMREGRCTYIPLFTTFSHGLRNKIHIIWFRVDLSDWNQNKENIFANCCFIAFVTIN
jgi:hypothetical protein